LEAGRTYRANAIVLRRINLGETDRLIVLYTREKGKLSGVAKGARRATSKLAASTEPGNYGRYFIAVGKELDVVTQAESLQSFTNIRRDLDRIGQASYLLELVNAMVEEREPNYELFDTLLSSLYLLENEADPQIVARYFDLQIMSLMGYRPELDVCLRCGAQPAADGITFSPSLGGRVCDECGPLPSDVIYLSRESVDVIRRLLAADAKQVREMTLSDAVKDEILQAIRWYVRYRLDRDLKSPDFIRALAGQEKTCG
jgi:DNA repair protein RecO (recombination protein O)